VVILGLSEPETEDKDTYANDSYKNDVNLRQRVEFLGTGEAIRACFPPQIPMPSFDKSIGYLNQDGGWVNAAQGLSLLLKRVIALNGEVLPGKNVIKLCPREKISEYGCPTIEIQCSDSTVLSADLVIVATGSWTASAFPELAIGNICLATG
jgi:sarcosine oxidase/L-pipecolate oxidase